jgi:hypothetical protein
MIDGLFFYLGYYLDNITDLEQSRIEGGPELFLYSSQVSYTTMILIYMEQEYFKRIEEEHAFFCCWNQLHPHCIPAEDLLPQRKHKGSWDKDKAYSTPEK